MSTVEELIIEQTKIFNRLKDYHFNFIGKYKTNVTIGALESRIITLGSNWQKYQNNHSD